MSFNNHRASFFIVVGRVFRYAFQNILRNFGLAIITISILVLSLISVNTLLAVKSLTAAAVHAIEKQVDISVFFVPEATEKQVDEVRAYMAQFNSVTTVDVISREDALAAFKARHADNPEILKSLAVLETNPLGAIVVVHTKDAKDYKVILDSFEKQTQFNSIVQRRSFEDRGKIVERVEFLTARAQDGALGLAALFALIAVLIVFNAIRVAIYTQREEISIKKLVGATNGFIRAPFFIEGFVYVSVSVGIVAGIMHIATRYIDPFLGPLFSGGGFSLHATFFQNSGQLFGIELVALLAITWMTSVIAMRKYLQK